jgi:phage gpG-like protein
MEFAEQKAIELAERFSESLEIELKTKLDTALRASWGWTSGSRDIIDTGELARSFSISTKSGEINFGYDSEYAGLVHYGGYIRPYGNLNADLVYLPARPWIDAVLGDAPGPIEPIDAGQIMSEAAR